MRNSKFIFILCLGVNFLFGCKKNLDESGLIPINGDQVKNTLTPYLFNWETADFMPAPPGVNIPVPWASNTNQGFSQDIRYDYKSSDGWNLVYNTFSPSGITQPKSFVLYNKYRGLLRFYLYVDPYNAPAPSDYITHSLKLEATSGATSSHLNFAASDMVYTGSGNRTQVSSILNYKVSSTSGWYAFEYELAYDPNITSQTYQNINFRWSAGTVSVTEVNLSGAINGTLKGTIGTPAAPPSFFGQLTNGVISLTGLAVLSNNPNLLPSKIQSAATTALNSGFQGVYKNLLSALFGGNTNNVQQVSLDLKTSITLAGTATTPAGLMDNVMVIPGVSNSQSTTGYAPLYNSPLGVFNISAKPRIKYTQASVTQPPGAPRGDYFRFGFTIDPTSYSLIFNPAVLSSATITNISSTIICLQPSYFYEVNGVLETVGDRDIKSGTSYVIDREKVLTGKFAVRVIFKVNPNNGAPPVTVIKTIIANVVPQ